MTNFPAFQTGGGRPNPNANPAGQGVSAQTQAGLARIRAGGNSDDFFGLASPGQKTGYQDPLPPVDFEWTWEKRRKDGSLEQRGFKAAQNSWRAGANRQRGDLGSSLQRVSESENVTHRGDLVHLPWAMEAGDLDPFDTCITCVCFGRAFLAPFLEQRIYAETSRSDPALTQFLAPSSPVNWMGRVNFNGVEYLGVNTLDGVTQFYTEDLTPGPASIAGFICTFLQVPQPGDVLLLHVGDGYRSASYDVLTSTWNVATENVYNTPTGFHAPIGMQVVGTRPLRPYWHRMHGAFPYNGRMDIVSCNIYGTDYQELKTNLNTIQFVARLRNGLLFTDCERVIFHHGAGTGDDLQICEDQPNIPGFRYYIGGLIPVDDDAFALVCKMPVEFFVDRDTAAAQTLPDNVDASFWRYDFDLKRWSQVSEWFEYTASALPNDWGRFRSGGIRGPVPAFGSPSLIAGPTTGYLHAPQAFISGAGQTYRKFQEPAGVVPYSLRGGEHDFAAGPLWTWGPGLIFPPGYELANKIVDYIEFFGQDGDTGSKIEIAVAEYGRKDLTDPGPLTRPFTNPISHGDRLYAIEDNQNALLFPQFGLRLTRGSVTNSTPQGLPFSVYGHVDVPVDPVKVPPWLDGLRAAQ